MRGQDPTPEQRAQLESVVDEFLEKAGLKKASNYRLEIGKVARPSVVEPKETKLIPEE